MGATPVFFIRFAESGADKASAKKFGIASAVSYAGAVLSAIYGSWLGAVGLLVFGVFVMLAVLVVALIRKIISKHGKKCEAPVFVKGFYRFGLTTAFFIITATGMFSHIYDGLVDVGITYALTQDNLCLAMWWIPSVVFAVIPSVLLITDNPGKSFKMLMGYLVFSALVVMTIDDVCAKLFSGSTTQVIDIIWETIGGKGYPQTVSTALLTVMNLSILYVCCLAMGIIGAFVVSFIRYRNKSVTVREQAVIVSVQQMRDADAYTIENGISGQELMHRAAMGIYESAEWDNKKIAILTGSGNNGGDGYALASILAENGIFSTVIRTSERFSVDGKFYYERARELGVCDFMFTKDTKLCEYDIIVDCILGTGFKGVPEGIVADAINAINQSGAYVISADINSGLNGDTGDATFAVKSDLTVSIGFYKQGMFKGEADTFIGKLINIDIGIIMPGQSDRNAELSAAGLR